MRFRKFTLIHKILRNSIFKGHGLGIYEFLRMAFVLSNTLSTFQRLIDRYLKKLDFCRAYIDDIVIFSDTFEEH